MLSNPGQGLRQAITILSEIVCVATNGALAIFLARRFNGITFIQYTSTISLVSSFGLLSSGIQASIAAQMNQPIPEIEVERSFHLRFTPTRLGIFMVIIWYTLVPLLSVFVKVNISNLLAAGLLIPSIILINISAGKLQGSSQLAKWKVITVISTFVQVPLVIFAGVMNAPIPIFISLLTIPGLVFFGISRRSTKKLIIATNMRIPFLISGCSAAIFALSTQLPYFYIRYQLPPSLIGPTGLYFYSNLVLINVTASLGAYLLPSLARERKAQNHLEVYTRHLIHLMPFFVYILLYIFIGDQITEFILGSSYVLQIGVSNFAMITISSIIWALSASIFQERMFLAGKRFLILAMTLLLSEIIFALYLSVFQYFAFHSLIGTLLFFLIPRFNK
jgi:hypothetical protein